MYACNLHVLLFVSFSCDMWLQGFVNFVDWKILFKTLTIRRNAFKLTLFENPAAVNVQLVTILAAQHM